MAIQSNFRQYLKSFIDRVLRSKKPHFAARLKVEDTVVTLKSDYDLINEPFHPLGSPKNVNRIKEAIKELDEGKGIIKELIEE